MSNGYTQIEISGKAVGLKFAWLAMKWFNEASIGKVDVYFAETEIKGKKTETYTSIGLAKLIQCAYRNNNEIKEVKDELTFEDFYNWVEEKTENEDGITELGRVVTVYSESSFSKKLVSEMEKKSKINGKMKVMSP